MDGNGKSTANDDIDVLVGKRRINGGDHWATADGRWGVGSPFSTLDCGLMLVELGLDRSDPVARGVAETLLACQTEDGRIRPGPHLAVQPCHTANALRLLCRLLPADAPRLQPSFDHLLATQAADGGWRCNALKFGAGPDTDASNPGVTLAVLDAFRFRPDLISGAAAERAVESLLEHWTLRRPLGPCRFGIGSRFLSVEYPFFRYNLFFYAYVLSFFPRAIRHPAFVEAAERLGHKLVGGAVVIEHQKPGLKPLGLFRTGLPNPHATWRHLEMLKNFSAR